MAAKSKRTSKTNVFWSRDRILFRHFAVVISMFSVLALCSKENYELCERQGTTCSIVKLMLFYLIQVSFTVAKSCQIKLSTLDVS